MDTSKSQHWLNLVTGWDMCMNEFLLAGERIRKLRRQYDVDYGIGREDDTLPPRILTQERRDGGSTHHLPPFKQDAFRLLCGERLECTGTTFCGDGSYRKGLKTEIQNSFEYKVDMQADAVFDFSVGDAKFKMF